jgi:hypothetical protein
MADTHALDPLPTYSVRVHRLSPMLAELHIEFAGLPNDVQVQGRLMGPRCPGVTTVEIAYPLQPLKHPVYRVRIPDPVYWSAERPFVYEGPAQILRDGQVIGKIALSYGIKG